MSASAQLAQLSQSTANSTSTTQSQPTTSQSNSENPDEKPLNLTKPKDETPGVGDKEGLSPKVAGLPPTFMPHGFLPYMSPAFSPHLTDPYHKDLLSNALPNLPSPPLPCKQYTSAFPPMYLPPSSLSSSLPPPLNPMGAALGFHGTPLTSLASLGNSVTSVSSSSPHSGQDKSKEDDYVTTTQSESCKKPHRLFVLVVDNNVFAIK